MAQLVVVRHGQASLFAADYDELSARGIEQAKRLGHWLRATGLRFDAAYTGPARRQRDTARWAAGRLLARQHDREQLRCLAFAATSLAEGDASSTGASRSITAKSSERSARRRWGANFLFTGPFAAGQRLAAAYTLVQSCRALDIFVREYPIDVIEKIAGGWPARRRADAATLEGNPADRLSGPAPNSPLVRRQRASPCLRC